METEKEAAAPANGNGTAREYWPRRMITTVREETLELWKEELGRKAAALNAELAKLGAGTAQIDAELARREALRKERRGQHGPGSKSEKAE